jgi:hypothetical protein
VSTLPVEMSFCRITCKFSAGSEIQNDEIGRLKIIKTKAKKIYGIIICRLCVRRNRHIPASFVIPVPIVIFIFQSLITFCQEDYLPVPSLFIVVSLSLCALGLSYSLCRQ